MKNKEKIKNLNNDFKFVTENTQIIMALMGYCIVVVWKGFELIDKINLEIEKYKFFYGSLFSAVFCLFLFTMTFLFIMWDQSNGIKRKVMVNVFFIMAVVFAVASLSLLASHIFLAINHYHSLIVILFASSIISVIIVISIYVLKHRKLK